MVAAGRSAGWAIIYLTERFGDATMSRQADEILPGVKITPEMSAAGVKFARDFMGDEWPTNIQDADLLVEGVYAAMCRTRSATKDTAPSNPREQP